MSADAETKERTTNALLLLMERIDKKLDQIISQTAPRQPADDESIGRDPSEKYWTGASHKGCRMSECSPAYLRAYAKYRAACVFMARKENDPAKMKYVDRDEKSAKLASEWAAYREAIGYVEPEQEKPSEGFPEQGEDSQIPF